MPAAEVVAAPSAVRLGGLAVCLLDASPAVQAARLTARGDDPNLLHHHHAFAEWMRLAAADPMPMPEVITTNGWDQMRWERLSSVADTWHTTTIDTTDLSRAQVADAVVAWCRSTLAGEVPVIKVS